MGLTTGNGPRQDMCDESSSLSGHKYTIKVMKISPEKVRTAVSSGHRIIRNRADGVVDIDASVVALSALYPIVNALPQISSLMSIAMETAKSVDVALAASSDRPQADWLF